MANQVLYGFMNMRDLFNERVTAVDVLTINRAIDASVAEHARQVDALTALFARQTTDYTIRYKTAGAGRLQPLDNNGRPLPIKPSGHYDLAFPLRAAGTAWGANRVTRIKMTIGEVNDITRSMLDHDARWVRDQMLSALFTNVSYTFVDDEHGSLTVMPLANADTQPYLIFDGADAGATDTHYLAQAAAIADVTNPFPTIYTELTEHPENGGDVIVLVPTNLRAACEGLATFHAIADANIRPADTTSVLVGNPGVQTPGTLFGYADHCFLYEWRSLPSNYMIATTTQGSPALAKREHPEAELRGFKRVADEEEYPYFESFYERRLGFGGWNRVGGVVMRIGNASYAIPSNYTAPLP